MTRRDGFPCKKVAKLDFYDEIVIDQESQVPSSSPLIIYSYILDCVPTPTHAR